MPRTGKRGPQKRKPTVTTVEIPASFGEFIHRRCVDIVDASLTRQRWGEDGLRMMTISVYLQAAEDVMQLMEKRGMDPTELFAAAVVPVEPEYQI